MLEVVQRDCPIVQVSAEESEDVDPVAAGVDTGAGVDTAAVVAGAVGTGTGTGAGVTGAEGVEDGEEIGALAEGVTQ